MRAFLRFVIKNPFAALLVAAVPVLLGLYAAFHMSVDLFPNLEVPVVNIVTHYPAGDPEDIELLISRPIEDEMRGIQGVSRVSSSSSEGISQVTAEFRWGTSVAQVRQLVESRLAQLRGRLPATAIPVIESIGAKLQEVVGYVLYGGEDTVALGNFARYDLTSRLMSVEGVSRVEVLGADQQAFDVVLTPETLARMQKPLSQVADAIRAANTVAMTGYVDRGGREYTMRGDSRIETIGDLGNVPLRMADGTWAPLNSLARIEEGKAPRHYTVRGNRVPAVAVVVHKQPGADTIRVVRDVEQAIAGLRRSLPEGTRLAKYYDQSEIIVEARDEIVHDLLIGMGLAVLVLFFFLGRLRPTLVVAVTIPLSLVSTLAVMKAFGQDFNVITMTALTLAIGMVVDDAIVVAENIFRYRQSGMGPRESALEGTATIAAADASGTFTTVAAFLPLVLTTGLAALFVRPFGLTISAALLLSLVLSLTVVPLLFSRIPVGNATRRSLGDRTLSGLAAALSAVLRFFFRHRWTAILLALLLLSSAVVTAFLGQSRMLPPIDEGAILIEYVMPPGTSLKESNRIGDILDRIAMANPDVTTVYRRTGSPEVGYQVEGVNRGEIVIKLESKDKRRQSLDQIMNTLRQSYSKIDGVVFLYHQPTQEKMDESFSGLPALFGVTIQGPDMNTLTELGGRVETIMASDPDISNIVNNTKVKAPLIRVRPRYGDLARFVSDPESVFNTLQAVRFGMEATRIVRQRAEIPILIRQAAPRPLDVETIRDLPVVNGNGSIVPMNRIADVQISHSPATITRLNGEREITLLADVGGNVTAAASRLLGRLDSLSLPRGYRVSITGQYKVLMKTVGELAFVGAAAILLIFLILVMQFHSWRQSLVILVTVPLSLVGGLVALWITRLGLDVSVGMGAITLIGISVNNAIVLTDFANGEMRGGAGAREALLSAATVRLRPVLLTALTTLFALIPAAIAVSVGSRIYQPFAVTVIGGLISGTIATLVFIPVFLTFGADRASKSKGEQQQAVG